VKTDLLVFFGKVSPRYLKLFDIGQDVFFADFNVDVLMRALKNNNTSFRELPKYPEVKRDLSMVLDKSVTFLQVRNAALKAEKKLLRNISLFDVYEGENIEAGKKSYALSFTLRDDLKTLTDKEIEKIMTNIQGTLEREVNARIRS
jgi:phenylalanyl-tRNA synthetase beta chain